MVLMVCTTTRAGCRTAGVPNDDRRPHAKTRVDSAYMAVADAGCFEVAFSVVRWCALRVSEMMICNFLVPLD